MVSDILEYCSWDIHIAMEALDCGCYIYMSSSAMYEPKHWNTVEEEL